MRNYQDFIANKCRFTDAEGIEPIGISDMLFDFQREIVKWSLAKGRSAIFADCGLGKTPMQLSWADNIAAVKDGNILILTPLAVADQTIREGEKFGIHVERSLGGSPKAPIVVSNYEKLHKFDPSDYVGIVCDESSILKNYSGKTRNAIIDFTKSIPFRLMCTATPAPNDYMELGGTCEALGVLRSTEMLSRFFEHKSGESGKWFIKGHAYNHFWKFLTDWAVSLRMPSDLGFENGKFKLPRLNETLTVVKSRPRSGMLFALEAISLDEQRAERRETINPRCEAVAEIANRNKKPFLAWCSLNDESKKLTSLINGAVELTGSDSDDEKERKMLGFSYGDIRCLVTKPSIAGFGMNWQHCDQMSFFPSHSYEQYYQAVRRCWRFGQNNTVDVHIVTSECESRVLENMRKKERESSEIFTQIVLHMRDQQSFLKTQYNPTKELEIPKWINA